MQWTFCCWCMSQTASNSIAHQGIYTATADLKNTQPFPLYQSAEWHAVLCECQQILFGDLFSLRAKHNRWEQFSSCQHSPEYNQSMNGAQTGVFFFFLTSRANFTPAEVWWLLCDAAHAVRKLNTGLCFAYVRIFDWQMLVKYCRATAWFSHHEIKRLQPTTREKNKKNKTRAATNDCFH